MTWIDAQLFDGRSSHRFAVRVELQAGGALLVEGEGYAQSFRAQEVEVSEGIADLPRSLNLANGWRLTTAANDAVDAWQAAQAKGGWQRLLHRWERSLVLAGVALALSVGALWATVQYVIPALAARVAARIPVQAEAGMGEEVLAALDGEFFAPSRLPAARQAQIRALFADLLGRERAAGGARPARLELRAGGKIGANAFALPGGTIVLTDELVRLARNDQEISAVLAHEMGHVLGRHTMRHVLQSSAAGLLLAAVTGDIVSLTAVGAALPAFLLEASYSREFEREADDHAYRYLVSNNIAPKHFAAILLRMDDKRGGDDSALTFLSTHPDSRARAQRFLGR